MNTKLMLGRGRLLLQKHQPEILLGVGIIGGIFAAILAVKSVHKAEEVKNQLAIELLEIEGVKKEALDVGDDQELIKQKSESYLRAALAYARVYGPAVGVGMLSITAILASHGVMKNRQVALVAAYNLVKEGYEAYRARVVEELGEEKDRMFHLGLREEEYTETIIDEEGKKAKVKGTRVVVDPNMKSVYARFFDETCSQWNKDRQTNRYFLQAQQNYANQLLTARGHVFLNEVYDMLGFPHTVEGCVVGWVLPKNGQPEGDGYISFDLFNEENEAGRHFINGYNNAILLDFNVDGVIFDKI